jgi:hypothetical protein
VAHGLSIDRMGWKLMADLLTIADLPEGFDYPAQFVRVVELGLTQFEPWWVIEGDILRDRHRGLKSRYPDRHLVPFAVRQDRDDVACFDVDSNKVVIIHDFTDPGWENRASLGGFNEWLRQAIEDLIEFGGG